MQVHKSWYLESMPFEFVRDQSYMYGILSGYLFEFNEGQKEILIAICGLLFESYPVEVTRFEK